MKKIKLMAVAVLAGLFLAGCDDDVPQTQRYQAPSNQVVDEQYVNQQPVVQAAPAPSTVVVQGGGHNSGVGDFATGMLMGHMMSNMSNNNGGGYRDNSSRTTIINNNVQSTPRSVYSAPRQTTNSNYTTRKSYTSPVSSYKPSKSYSSKSYSSGRSSFSSRSSSSRRR